MSILNQANLLNKSKQTAQNVERDLNAFESFGYSINNVMELNAAIVALENSVSWMETETDRLEATKLRQEAELALRANLRVLLYRVKDRLGDKSPHYRKLMASKILGMGINILMNNTTKVYNILKRKQVYTNVVGITPETLNSLFFMAEAFEQAVLHEKEVIERNKLITKERKLLFDDLYNKTMRLNRTGKLIFRYTDEVRYKSYIVYDTRSKINYAA